MYKIVYAIRLQSDYMRNKALITGKIRIDIAAYLKQTIPAS